MQELKAERKPHSAMSIEEYVKWQDYLFNSAKGDGDCPKCNGKGYIQKSRLEKGFWYPDVYECECLSKTKNEIRIKKSGLADVIERYTFESFKTKEEWQKRLKASAEKFAENPGNWFYVGGQSGCGKTHICTAIVKTLMEKGFESKYIIWTEEITKLKGKYQYHLDIGKIEGLKNFQSFSINKKTKQNEVYVNHALITKIKQNKLIYKINHHQYTLKIKGVIQDDYQEPVLYYHSLSNEIALQCIDVSTCIVYVKNHKYMKDYLTHLSVQYQGIAPIYEEYESYFKVIDLFKKVSLVFIFLSFMIAIVLMGYMVLSMFYENQKIYAIMLANGYQNNHLAFFILKKISLMMISIGIVSCLVSSGVLKIISFFDISKKIWGINHLFVLPREFQWPFTLYFFYLLGYIVQGILLSLFIVLKMKKIKMYECLREE